ncbi:nucleotide sugar dehydrogenase [Desulfurobacterium thermolithotrophum DSM 11699]|uniref:UDP-glucose 6-dehydrogenase n=1 Tax=Desulfurobacterium thermolithotrophum (strain DSM 11699 / BSA) TaxID=868864 RepID=F0S327_DESTD|nr:UDP-glucose/GDP-mannose dehydrogenase family protein [Desulfurobacterium thermolithotrophum]ADY73249.1 nucleotide sugar dehydrogenase [Desulfurobacterium thermolithotrophum DSM 11699]
MSSKRIAVIGTGYVGLVSGACFAYLGHKVIGLDIDEKKIELLRKGEVPIYEPGLDRILRRALERGNIEFTTDYEYAVKNSDFIFIAVGTPSKEDGSADLSYVESAYKSIAEYIGNEDFKIIVNKSTVPVGTGRWAKEFIKSLLEKRGIKNPEERFEIVSNPEFLREGKAVEDFMKPDRVVVGADNRDIAGMVASLYEKLQPAMLITDLPTAEMIKYASNSFLATKISFINEIANICEKLGADVTVVARGMGLDHRISPYFLNAGCGFGGSCFPKDVKALIHTAKSVGEEPKLLSSVMKVNEKQKLRPIEKLLKHIPELKDKTIAVWGLAFKPETDDMREAPSIPLVRKLLSLGAKVKAYDPVAMENAKKVFKEEIKTFGEKLLFVDDKYEALEGADALILITEWNEFKEVEFDKLKGKVIIDGRNIWEPSVMRQFCVYESIGRV